MALYILKRQDPAHFLKSKSVHNFSTIKGLNQKRIPTVVFESFDDVPEVFSDPEALVLITDSITPADEDFLQRCQAHGVPVCAYTPENHPLAARYSCCTISDDDTAAATMVYEYFHIHGKDRVAFFGFYANSYSDISKIDSFFRVDPAFSADDIFPIKSGISACFEDFFPRRADYDGVYFPNDFVALAFLDAMLSRDPDYLKDRFFIGWMCSLMSELYRYPLSTVACKTYAQINAVMQVYRTMAHGRDEFSNIRVSLNCTLVVRDSTGKKPRRLDYPPLPMRTCTLSHAPVPFYDHRSDPALKDIFALEELFSDAKEIDRLIFYLLIKGYSATQIADRLFLSQQTLNRRKKPYLQKTGCSGWHSLAALLAHYIAPQNLETQIRRFADPQSKPIDFSKF